MVMRRRLLMVVVSGMVMGPGLGEEDLMEGGVETLWEDVVGGRCIIEWKRNIPARLLYSL